VGEEEEEKKKKKNWGMRGCFDLILVCVFFLEILRCQLVSGCTRLIINNIDFSFSQKKKKFFFYFDGSPQLSIFNDLTVCLHIYQDILIYPNRLSSLSLDCKASIHLII
jgi:hypothetical protein